MPYSKDFIKERLDENDKWVIRGICAIYNQQTELEKVTQNTQTHNGIGFNKVDASFLSSLAEQAQNKGFLSAKQIMYGRKKIKKYVRQLVEIANEKLYL